MQAGIQYLIDLLKEVITEFKNNNIRTSIFIDTNHQFIEGAKDVGADIVIYRIICC